MNITGKYNCVSIHLSSVDVVCDMNITGKYNWLSLIPLGRVVCDMSIIGKCNMHFYLPNTICVLQGNTTIKMEKKNV